MFWIVLTKGKFKISFAITLLVLTFLKYTVLYTGGLIGMVESSKNNSININNIFSSSKVSGSNVDQETKGGIIGIITANNSINSNANVSIKDILNIGYINTNLKVRWYNEISDIPNNGSIKSFNK